MSRPKLLPPLAPETLACLDRIGGTAPPDLAPRHEVNAEADHRLLEIVRAMGMAEKHLRFMDAAAKAGTLVSSGPPGYKPMRSTAQWAKRTSDDFTEVCRVATEVGDAAFPLHLEAIRRGRDNPPMPLRWWVWMGWRWCSLAGRMKYSDEEMEQLIESQSAYATCDPPPDRPPYVPTAGEVAASIGASEHRAELTVRDCTNHLKALGLPYAPARRGKRKSI
jgi:hypothetical protein